MIRGAKFFMEDDEILDLLGDPLTIQYLGARRLQ